MKTLKMIVFLLVLLTALSAFSGCGSDVVNGQDPDGDTQNDGDIDETADGDDEFTIDGDTDKDTDFVTDGDDEQETEAEPDGDTENDIDNDTDLEPDIECPEIELNCVSYCDNNIATNCTGKINGNGCGYNDWTYEDCGNDTCVEDFGNNLAYCESTDGDLENDTVEVECEMVPPNCVSHCDNNVAMVCTPGIDTNGCPYNNWQNTDCLDDVCIEDFDNGTAYCESIDGDEEIVEEELEEEPPACGSTLNLTCDNNFVHTILAQQQQDLIDVYSCDDSLNLDSPEVIYTFSTDNDCSVEISLTNMSANFSLFKLSACSGDYCEDSSTSAGSADESITFETLTDEEHLIAVDASGNVFSSYTINVECTCAVDGDEEEAEEEQELEIDGETLELSAIGGMTPYFDFDAYDQNFFGSPWPNDFYKDGDGNLIMDDFPLPDPFQNFEGYALMTLYKGQAENMDGFGNNTAVYWTFPAEINTGSLPTTPSDSMSFAGSILLINIDTESNYYNELTPVEWHWTSRSTGTFEPADRMLAVAPVDGFPLEPHTTYAMILTDGVQDYTGTPLGRTATMADLYSGRGTGDSKLDYAYVPFATWLAANDDKLNQTRVRAVTVFTTQDPVLETKEMADYIKAEYPNGELTGTMNSCEYSHNETGYVCFKGSYTSPNFQSGNKPYDILTGGGGSFMFDSNGDPIEQESENIDFSLCVPSDASVPSGGWPIVMYSHGTTGDEDSFVNSGPNNIADFLLDKKMAVIGILQPLHGTRGDNYTDEELETYSFNFTNPDSARATIRQSVMDTVALNSFIKAGKLSITSSSCDSWPASGVYSGPGTITFDTDNILFMGHSQGGLTGSMAAAVEPDIKGWVLSGAGGRMGITVMERTSPNILALLESYSIIDQTDAHKHHPLIMMVQLMSEITDPINYAPYWVEKPFNSDARNIMVTTGFSDSQTPKNSTYAMCVAGRIPQIDPETPPLDEVVTGLTLRNITSFSRNASNTVKGPSNTDATCGLLQYPSDGHFAIFYNDDAAYMYQEYLRSIAYSGVGILGYE